MKTFKEFLTEANSKTFELADLLDDIYNSSGKKFNQENINKVNNLYISGEVNKKYNLLIGRHKNSITGWVNSLNREWEQKNGTYKFDVKFKTISQLATRIEDFTKGEKVARIAAVFTSLSGNKSKTPTDFIVFTSKSDLDEAWNFLKKFAKEVQITELGTTVNALKIDDFIIENASSTGGRTSFELSIAGLSYYKNTTRIIS